jgi:hypothetical protein
MTAAAIAEARPDRRSAARNTSAVPRAATRAWAIRSQRVEAGAGIPSKASRTG